MPSSKNTTKRHRKFIRKDSAREYQSRSGMIETSNPDGTSTYFTPNDLFQTVPKVQEPPMHPCIFCGKKTARTKNIAGVEESVCVMCKIANRDKP